MMVAPLRAPRLSGDVAEPAGLDLVDEAADGDVLDPGMGPNALDLGAQVRLEVRERVERDIEIGAGLGCDLEPHPLIVERQHAAARVLHDDDLVGAEQMLADHERADRVVSSQAAGVPDDVSVARSQSEHLLDRKPRVHARDDGKPPRRRPWKRGSIEPACVPPVRGQGTGELTRRWRGHGIVGHPDGMVSRRRRQVTAGYPVGMSVIPDRFQAFVAERRGDDAVQRGLRSFAAADLPEGELDVRIDWSSVNYKDALATIVDGKVARIDPLIPGIDLAGEVVASRDPVFSPGDAILAHGYDLGVARHGGFGEYTRLPAGYAVPLATGLTPREAMAIGTAGFTAAMSVAALEERGLRPGDGPVLVTGASGGVGSNAVAILASRGHEVWAATGKGDEEPRLRSLGASGIVPRDEVTAESPRPLESARWAGAVDAVGGATLPYVLRTLRPGATVASSGNAGGPLLRTTVLPFILRGVALVGMDSSAVPIEARRALWARLGSDLRPNALGDGITEVTLETLEPALDGILAGAARGRWIVRVSS